MNFYIYSYIPKCNQNLSSYKQKKCTRGILCHNCPWLLNNVPINLAKNGLQNGLDISVSG